MVEKHDGEKAVEEAGGIVARAQRLSRRSARQSHEDPIVMPTIVLGSGVLSTIRLGIDLISNSVKTPEAAAGEFLMSAFALTIISLAAYGLFRVRNSHTK